MINFGLGRSLSGLNRLRNGCQWPSSTKWNKARLLTSLSGRKKFRLGKHVEEAIKNGDPIVALESTVITHGLPEPENLKLALSLERTIIETKTDGQAVVPATIGIIKGDLVVGLSNDEVQFLADINHSKPMKASRRDIPIAMALGLSAGTTVAATMAIAASLNTQSMVSSISGKVIGCQFSPIRVFATGGTGGVHRGGENSLDISADLFEFTRSPICVVSSGFKSFLDTRRTLEYLETLGCTVMSLYNGTDDLFPSFYFRRNFEGISSPQIVENPNEAARILYECFESDELADRRGALLAIPIEEEFSLDNLNDEIGEKISEAIRSIETRKDLKGKEKTPLILEQLNRVTAGKSLKANIHLLRNNARFGAILAHEYAKLRNNISAGGKLTQGNLYDRIEDTKDKIMRDLKDNDLSNEKKSAYRGQALEASRGDVIVVGCTMIDMHVSTQMDENFKNNPPFSGITFKGEPHLSLGGVGRNLAVALKYLGCNPTFITALGTDQLASFAQNSLDSSGLSDSNGGLHVVRPESDRFPSCFAMVLLDSLTGQCEYVIANLDAVSLINRATIDKYNHLITRAKLVILDANLSQEAFSRILELTHNSKVPIFLEPTDGLAIPRLVESIKHLRTSRESKTLSSLAYMSPNLIEFRMMFNQFENVQYNGSLENLAETRSIHAIENDAKILMSNHLPELKCLLITMDKDGVLVAIRHREGSNPFDEEHLLLRFNERLDPIPESISFKRFMVPQIIGKPVSASGAGDSFAASFISGLLSGSSISNSIMLGFEGSKTALEDNDTISIKLKSLKRFT